MKKKEPDIYNQDRSFIITQQPHSRVLAIIYDFQQRAMIQQLIDQGFLPHHTSVGRGNLAGANWKIEDYNGKFGTGIKMISRSPMSYNFNHLTYFVK